MAYRFFSLLLDAPSSEEPKVRHLIGLPFEVSGTPGEQLALAKLLVIDEDSEGIFLIRYAADGSFAGDTWHPSLEEAEEQVSYEFGERFTAWEELGSESFDPLSLLRNPPSN